MQEKAKGGILGLARDKGGISAIQKGKGGISAIPRVALVQNMGKV